MAGYTIKEKGQELTPKDEKDYRLLYAAMADLYEECEKRKADVKKLILELEGLRKKAAGGLQKTKSLTRRLSAYQLKEMGFFRNPGAPVVPALAVPAPPVPALPDTPLSRSGLKAQEVKIVSIISQLKKTLLQLELMELRCRELLAAITKALPAYSHELRNSRRKIYPFMVFSRIYKNLRSFFGGPYYSPGDLRELASLGALAVHIVNIAESPLL
jgi:hypothetical protein